MPTMSERRRSLTAALMVAEAVTLAIASIVHFGVVIGLGIVTLNDPFEGARVPEAIIAVVLAVGGLSLLLRLRGDRWLALGATLFAILGVLVGLSVVLFGGVSRPGDAVYHVSLLIALLLTLVVQITASERARTAAHDRGAA